MSSGESEHVLPFPTTLTEVSSEEKAHRVRAEAERLSRLAEVDWKFQLKARATLFGIEEPILRGMVVALVKACEKRIREEKAEDQRREKQRLADQKREERERQREQDRADQEAQRKRQEKEREFKRIGELPRAEHDARLTALARRIGEDPAALRQEYEDFTSGSTTLGDLLSPRAAPETPPAWNVEPWQEPVDIAQLLQEIHEIISKYAVLGKHYLTALVLWIALNWVHNEIATHSPFLEIFSVDEGSGKTLVLGLLSWLTQRPCQGAEFTGPNIYRTVDRDQPTLIIDEGDDAFERRPDLKHIMNHSWTRGAKIPRQVRINGELQTYWFNIFCPKIIGRALLPGTGKAKPLPRTIARRCISIKIWPKREDEQVDEFGYCDDNEFMTLRRKLLRFANDQAKAIAEIKPTFPAGFNNSVKANWKLQLTIAELAGDRLAEACARSSGIHCLKSSRQRRWPAVRGVLCDVL